MLPTDDTSAAPCTRDDLGEFLDDTEEETAADGAGRRRNDLVFGLIALPVLFVALVASTAWVVPVVTTWLPVVVDFVSLARIG